jgi:hypothetical protein
LKFDFFIVRREKEMKKVMPLRNEGLVYLQGLEGGRAFSFVIDEDSGRMTVAVSRDGIAVNVFGICTGTDL